ncbi:unnamed protein product [Vitrella brassicaformis CCMP3155]|uniref:J domain-containing protein n=1 Tax=Vitrella brassicaformis (strain CCMP3155) TaxID=1169540 RepID=A0A0G4F8D5_VITBC|nr:unnamed protein product [Vitrella brassicaformis CCMP3155]|eukprot:CEM08983.1 unnamed protein product [Vitrella brassicaformis CCMP3155]
MPASRWMRSPGCWKSEIEAVPMIVSHADALKALGLQTSATLADVKTRFHERCLKCHPDKAGSSAALRKLHEAYKVACATLVSGTVAAGRQKASFTPDDLDRLREQRDEASRIAASSQAASKAWLAKLQEVWAREAAGEEVDEEAFVEEARRAPRAAAEEAKRNFDKATAARPTEEEPAAAKKDIPPATRTRGANPHTAPAQPPPTMATTTKSAATAAKKPPAKPTKAVAQPPPTKATKRPAAAAMQRPAPTVPAAATRVSKRQLQHQQEARARRQELEKRSEEAVKHRFRKCHPDKGASAASFQQLHEAYEVACEYLAEASVARVRKCHPDKDGSSAAFQQLREAYKVACATLVSGTVEGGRQKTFITPDDLDRLRAQRDEASRIAAASQAASMVWLAKFQERWAREAAGEEVHKETWGEEARLAAEAAAEEAKRHFDEATTAHTTHGTTPADASSFGRHCTAQHSIR